MGGDHEHEHGHKEGSDHDHKHEHGHKEVSDHDHKHKHDHKDSSHHDHKEEHGHTGGLKHGSDHNHEHSHDHGEDCNICGSLITPDDVKDVEMPLWKKRALELGSAESSSVAPFGGSWNTEASVAATSKPLKLTDTEHSHADKHEHAHGHAHDHLEHAGHFADRPVAQDRDYTNRPFTVGIGGPVGSGKTALMLALCRMLRDKMSLGAVTNDIFTREDGEFLFRKNALEKERIVAVETGGYPHAAIREDISANLDACEKLAARFIMSDRPIDLILLESGGDNLAANFSRELADLTLYVIDVAGGDKVPRKGGPGVTQSDVLIINKTDLAEAVGASLKIMDQDAKKMRGDGPIVFAQVRENLGQGVEDIAEHAVQAWKKATGRK